MNVSIFAHWPQSYNNIQQLISTVLNQYGPVYLSSNYIRLRIDTERPIEPNEKFVHITKATSPDIIKDAYDRFEMAASKGQL